MTTRQNLVNDAAQWLFNWNWKAFRIEQGDPHPEDLLTQNQIEYAKQLTNKTPKPHVLRDYANAHDALENAIHHIPKAKEYYLNLSERGLNRLLNEVTRKANERLERRKESYFFAKYRANEGRQDWQERFEKIRKL